MSNSKANAVSSRLQHRPLAALEQLKEICPEQKADRGFPGKEKAVFSRKPQPDAHLPPKEFYKVDAHLEADGETLFYMAVGKVHPLSGKSRVPMPAPPKPREAPVQSEADQVMEELDRLVDGQTEFDIRLGHEYIEGLAPGEDKSLLTSLQNGAWAVQAHLDLHGHHRRSAKEDILHFIQESVRKRRRCVIIVHGRGLHSPDGVPVLKECLRSWLCRGEVGREVLAFCSCSSHDGGWGAVYVLLRDRLSLRQESNYGR